MMTKVIAGFKKRKLSFRPFKGVLERNPIARKLSASDAVEHVNTV